MPAQARFCALFLLTILLATTAAVAQERVLVTRSNKVNMRVGPGRQYQVKWVYVKRGIPLRVMATLDNWLQVEDIDGVMGWILADSLVRNKDGYALTKAEPTRALSSCKEDAALAFSADAGVLVRVKKCKEECCLVVAEDRTGWVKSGDLWR
jgi:SH3-like domain-containing protein